MYRQILGFPGTSVGKESTCDAGNPNSIPQLGRSPGEGTVHPLQYSQASLVAQMVKNPLVMWETWVLSLGWEEEGIATHSNILTWRIPMDRGAWNTTVHGVTTKRLSTAQHRQILFDPTDMRYLEQSNLSSQKVYWQMPRAGGGEAGGDGEWEVSF